MIIGIGIDVADNSRFISLAEGVKQKLFTQNEIALALESANQVEYYSSRFAAKEAFSKSLGTGFKGINPNEIEILSDKSGKPYINLLKKLDKDYRIHLSISHEKSVSVAMVVLEDGTL